MNKAKINQAPDPDPKPVKQEPRVIITQKAKQGSPQPGDYMLIIMSAIAVDSRIIYRGECVTEAEYKKFPQFIQAYFLCVGEAIPAHKLKKIPSDLQKYFGEGN